MLNVFSATEHHTGRKWGDYQRTQIKFRGPSWLLWRMFIFTYLLAQNVKKGGAFLFSDLKPRQRSYFQFAVETRGLEKHGFFHSSSNYIIKGSTWKFEEKSTATKVEQFKRQCHYFHQHNGFPLFNVYCFCQWSPIQVKHFNASEISIVLVLPLQNRLIHILNLVRTRYYLTQSRR